MDGFIVVFDVSASNQQFADVSEWISTITIFKDKSNIVLVGNKCDLPRVVTKTMAQDHGCPYIETVAKEGTNVCPAFNSLLLQLMGQPQAASKARENVISLDNRDPAPAEGKCPC